MAGPLPIPTATAGPRSPRRGVVLIAVAGLCALLAALTLSFLLHMRAEAAEGRALVRYAQARAMLFAACSYILEAGRIGWDRECSGWVDTRDGFQGPKPDPYLYADIQQLLVTYNTEVGNLAQTELDAFRVRHGIAILPEPRDLKDRRTGLARPALVALQNRGLDEEFWQICVRAARQLVPSPCFPIGQVGRFPLQAWRRPPFALATTTTPNPILTTVTVPALPFTDPAFGQPWLSRPDPQPFNLDLASGALSDPVAFASGDPEPLPGSGGRGWFRVCRDGPATFTITCGAGGSQGFRDWSEVVLLGKEHLFGDERVFEEIVASEIRLWYRLEWSPAVPYGVLKKGGKRDVGNNHQVQSVTGKKYLNSSGGTPLESTHGGWNDCGLCDSGENYTPGHDFASDFSGNNGYAPSQTSLVPSALNACGTIQWIQRLPRPPIVW